MATPPATPPQKYTFDTDFFEVVSGAGGNAAGGAAAGAGSPHQGTRAAHQAHQAQQAAEQKQEAYDEGYKTGLAEGQRQAQADLAVMQQHLQGTLAALNKMAAEREEQLLTQTLALVRATLYHLVGDVVRHYPDELLEQHLRMVLPLVKADESLTLRIHPQARGFHEKLGLPHASIMNIPMHVVADAALGPTDAVVEWKNGGVESRLSQHLEGLTRQLEAAGVPLLATPPLPEPEAGKKSAPQPGFQAAAQPATEATPAPSRPAPQQTATSVLDEVAQAGRSRAAELLGDDDLVDALKS